MQVMPSQVFNYKIKCKSTVLFDAVNAKLFMVELKLISRMKKCNLKKRKNFNFVLLDLNF